MSDNANLAGQEPNLAYVPIGEFDRDGVHLVVGAEPALIEAELPPDGVRAGQAVYCMDCPGCGEKTMHVYHREWQGPGDRLVRCLKCWKMRAERPFTAEDVAAILGGIKENDDVHE